MKKSLIAGAGVAALGMAVLPFAGVFAASSTTKVDTISLVVKETCTMAGSADETSAAYGEVAVNTALDEKTTSAMTIKCNASGGWTLGYGAAALHSETNGNADILFGAYPETPSASVWSAKVTLGGVTTDATASLTYATSATSGTAVEANKPTDTKTGVTVTPSYKGYIGSNQGVGEYTGTMTYTFNKK